MIYACSLYSSFVLFAVNDLVTKYKLQKDGSAKRRCFSNEGQRLIDAVTAASDEGKQTERHC